MIKAHSQRIILFTAVVVAASVIIFNCSKIKGTGDEGDVATSIAQQEPVFPHKDTWANPEVHGAYVRKGGVTDTTPCANACHGNNLEGGSGPSCKKCHEDWPHEDGWRDKAKHGEFVIKNGKSRCATKCHGADLSGGLAEVSCVNCHAIYPHSSDFSNEEVHGPLAAGEKKKDCITCHGEDLLGGDSGRSCYECHKSYPHSSDWGKKENHGTWITANSKEACATKCHGADLAGGLSGVSCDKCHESLPLHYETGWAGAGHGMYVIENSVKDNFAECKKCHGSSLEGTASAPSCSKASCHASYPDKHLEEGWNGKGGHDSFTDTLEKLEGCKLCHGSDLTGGNTGVTCNSCHAIIPEHFGSSWKSLDHGKFALTNDDYFSEEAYSGKCQYCHGNWYSLTAEWPSGAIVTVSGTPMCYSCHVAYPHHNLDYGDEIFDWKWGETAAHMIYVINNEHFNEHDWIGNVVKDCGGGTNGYCHKGVRQKKSKKLGKLDSACNILCHSKKP